MIVEKVKNGYKYKVDTDCFFCTRGISHQDPLAHSNSVSRGRAERRRRRELLRSSGRAGR